MMVSYSMGINRSRAAWRRRRWYVRSIQFTMATRNSSRVSHRRRSSTLFYKRTKNDSMVALSAAEPIWTIELTI